MSIEGPNKTYRVMIGRAVARARAAGYPWKQITHWFAYGRTRLYHFMREAEVESAKCGVQGANSGFSITIFSHDRSGYGQGAAARVLSERS